MNQPSSTPSSTTPTTDTSSLGDLIRPLPGKVAVLVESKKEWTPSGLFIPVDTARSVHEERATQGTVIAIGEDEEDLESAPLPIKKGDVVIFGKYTGTRIVYQPDRMKDRETVIVMQVSSILAVLMSPEEARNLKVRG